MHGAPLQHAPHFPLFTPHLAVHFFPPLNSHSFYQDLPLRVISDRRRADQRAVVSMGNLSLPQWIFHTQESNQGLLNCRQILYQLSYWGSPIRKNHVQNRHC